MQIVQYLQKFKLADIRNILIYDVESISKNEILEISNYTKDLYVLSHNNFLVSSLSIQLRFNKNIHVLSAFHIPNVEYEIIFSYKIKEILGFLINNERIHYFINLNENKNLVIPGYECIEENIFKRLKNKILVDINSASNEFEKKKEAIKEIDEIILNKKIEKNKNEIEKNYYEINIKTLVPIQIAYKKQIENKNVDGILNILYIVSCEEDVNNFNKKIDIIQNQYSYIKLFLVINGSENFKYLTKFKNYNNLLKFEEKQNIDFIYNVYKDSTNNEYCLLLNDVEENKLNDIWKVLK